MSLLAPFAVITLGERGALLLRFRRHGKRLVAGLNSHIKLLRRGHKVGEPRRIGYAAAGGPGFTGSSDTTGA